MGLCLCIVWILVHRSCAWIYVAVAVSIFITNSKPALLLKERIFPWKPTPSPSNSGTMITMHLIQQPTQTHSTALPRAVNAAAQLRPASNLQFAILRPASNFLQHFQNQVHHGHGRPAINKKIEPDQAWPVPTHPSTFDNTRIFLAFTRPGEIRSWQGRIWWVWSLQYVCFI